MVEGGSDCSLVEGGSGCSRGVAALWLKGGVAALWLKGGVAVPGEWLFQGSGLFQVIEAACGGRLYHAGCYLSSASQLYTPFNISLFPTFRYDSQLALFLYPIIIIWCLCVVCAPWLYILEGK